MCHGNTWYISAHVLIYQLISFCSISCRASRNAHSILTELNQLRKQGDEQGPVRVYH